MRDWSDLPSRTGGRSLRSFGRRKAVSFGARAPYLGARSSAIAETPARICRNRRLLVRAGTGGVVKTPVLTRPDHGWTVLRPGADRARAGSVGGSAEPDGRPGLRQPFARKEARLRPEGASAPHRWGAGDAPSHFFQPPRACRPRPTSPDLFRTRRLPPNRRRNISRAGFWFGEKCPLSRHPRA